MRHRAPLLVLALVATSIAGCLGEEPADMPRAATAAALVPDGSELGRPSEWSQDLGQGPRALEGTPELLMAFAVETASPNGSRLVDGLYNMREHVDADDAFGDGAAPDWLYQYRDLSDVRYQHIAAANGHDASAYGAMWDWSYWQLSSADRPLPPWDVDSDEAAAVAAEYLDGWGDPALDHAYLLYVPNGTTTPHWLLALWDATGTERRHLVVRATDAAVVPFDEVHPEVMVSMTTSGVLAAGANPEDTYPIQPHAERGRLVVRLSPQPPEPNLNVDIAVTVDGWSEPETLDTASGAHVLVLTSLGGGTVEVTLTPRAPAARYVLEWCADGRFNDIFGRTPRLCDPFLA